MRRDSRFFLRRMGIFLTTVMALILAAPVGFTVLGAFSNASWYGMRSEGASVTTTAAVFHYVWSIWGQALWGSAKIVAVVIPSALLISVPAAYAFRRYPFPGSEWIESATLSMLSVPGIAFAFAYLTAIGYLPRFLLLAAGHLVYTLPLVLKTVSNGLEKHDPEIESAARTLGAGPYEVVRRILIPVLVPSLVLSALLVFMVSWGEFNVSYLLATPLIETFPAALYATYTTNSFPVAAAATAIFLFPVIPILVAIQLLGGETFDRGIQP